MKNILQNIYIPQENKGKNVSTINFISEYFISNMKCYSSKTYFNIFNSMLFYELCGINNILFSAVLKGEGHFEIRSIDKNQNDTCFYTIEVDSKDTEFVIDNLLDINNNYYYIVYESSLFLKNACFYTKDPSKNDINIGVVCTTYNRFDDVKNLIDIYSNVLDNVLLKDSQLIIVNNGDDLPFKIKDNNNIKVIKNDGNYGGAGGFTKGLEYVVQQKNFSHFIFIDDDAFFYPETLLRTYYLLTNIQQKYLKSAILGSMFEKDNFDYCHCILEAVKLKNLHHKLLIGNVYIKDNDVIELLNEVYRFICDYNSNKKLSYIPYAAWWYCCMPCNIVDEFNYPMKGYFFRGDDIEYGLRTKLKVISLNGIQVWHPAFSKKSSLLRTYFGFRNYCLNNILHNKNTALKSILLTYIVAIKRDIASNNYNDFLVRIKAIEDLAKFKNNFTTPDTINSFIKKVDKKKNFKISILIKGVFCAFKFIITFNKIRRELISLLPKV